jgi:glutamyl/glutaminyl-tRNA synthetase
LDNFDPLSLCIRGIGSKLSKRDKASTIEDYIKIGILSDALRK